MRSNYNKDVTAKTPCDYLDGQMTRNEIAMALQDMKFARRGDIQPIELDRDVRDFLLNLLRGR